MNVVRGFWFLKSMSERQSGDSWQRASAVAIAAGMATPSDQKKCQGICFVTDTQQRTQLHGTGSQGPAASGAGRRSFFLKRVVPAEPPPVHAQCYDLGTAVEPC